MSVNQVFDAIVMRAFLTVSQVFDDPLALHVTRDTQSVVERIAGAMDRDQQVLRLQRRAC